MLIHNAEYKGDERFDIDEGNLKVWLGGVRNLDSDKPDMVWIDSGRSVRDAFPVDKDPEDGTDDWEDLTDVQNANCLGVEIFGNQFDDDEERVCDFIEGSIIVRDAECP